MDELILLGGGGHCKSCIDVIEIEGKYKIAGIVDVKENIGQKILGYPVIGSDDDLNNIQKQYKYFHICVGQIKNNSLRVSLFEKLNHNGIIFPKIISPLAYVSKHAIIGDGSIIMHRAVINSDVRIGSFNIINTNSVIEHDSVLGDFNHISVSTNICGTVVIGNNCFIGSNSTVMNNVEISDSVVIGANSFVNKRVNQPGTYIGAPLRRIYE